ncbi:MAG: NAD+ synthase [Sedimentisphaerales bacterium]|nr:NAD+ synthase [Sedimentisphaerales bacterium]
MRIGLGQFDAVVGDLEGNAKRMREIYKQAKSESVELLLFPELAVCGYPPEDLLHKKHFLEENHQVVEKLAADCPDLTIVVGFADLSRGLTYNSAGVLRGGKIEKVYRKGLLPNYGVFDEQRYFEPGHTPLVVTQNGINFAVTICMDIWDNDWLAKFLKKAGRIDMLLNISASPFHLNKIETRKEIVAQCATRFKCPACYCNLVGGQDELVFDGRSMFADATGKIAAMAKAFEGDLLIADVEKTGKVVSIGPVGDCQGQAISTLEEMYRALVLGTRDYVRKNGFKKVIVGLSGGIDSAVTAAIAVAALGAENVVGITMPSRFNSPETVGDSEKCAENLGIRFMTIPIWPVLEQFNKSLEQAPGWDNKGLAYENLQARIRGTILMSLSNQWGVLVLTTGNKSETAVGYSTLYGDTAGGFAVIKDVFKTMVYKLARYINDINKREVIPQSVIDRIPTAELRANQKDTDSLPEYELLDKILRGYVEEDKSAHQLIKEGLPKDIVNRVISMVDRNEYKRRQSPPGVKITPKAFGRDRRLPITNRYNHRV